MKTTGNTIFIPGGTSGIGLGLALRFHAAGNKVIIGGRREALIERIVGEHDGVEGVVIDTADPESIVRTARLVQARWPETNVLVNMAGIMPDEDFRSGDLVETAEAVVTTNLLGPIRLIGGFVEFLTGQEHATIVNVSSGLAFVPLASTPTYNATKAAIHLLSEGIRLQLADTSVQVLELVPPKVQTALQPGQENAEDALPLEDYLDEVMTLLDTQPDGDEILVERVKFLRYPERNGGYARVLSALNR